MKRRIVSFVLIVMALPLITTMGRAQMNTWRTIGQLGLGIQCGYFWNRGAGVVATGGGQFYYLKSGGVWRPGLKLPYHSLINSIRCFDGKTLYATALYNGYQLWKSNDSGVTWSLLPQQGAANAYGTDNGPDVYWDYRTNAPVLRGSTDVRLDSLDIASAYDFINQGPPSTSLDGGLTWRTGTLTGPLGYNFYSGCGTCADRINKLYYATADGGSPGVFRSSDSGRSWTCLTSLPQNLYMMDDIEGIYDKIFIQTSKGIYETMDSGNTWKNIGGPARANSDDARFFVFGCTGQAVVAFGDNGDIDILNAWDAPDPNEVHSTFSATTTECDSANIVINVDLNFEPGRLHIEIEDDSDGVFTLLSPDTIQLTAFGSNQIIVSFKGIDLAGHSAVLSITPIDYDECPVTHPIYGQAHLAPPAVKPPKPILACQQATSQFLITNPNCELLRVTKDSFSTQNLIPVAFDSVINDTGSIPFTCKMLPQQGTITYPVFIEGYFEPSHTPFDTTVSVMVNYNYTPSALVPSLASINLDTLNPCLGADTSFVIENSGCDTLWVPLSQQNLATCWTLAPSTDTLELLPGEFDTISVHFSSSIPGNYNQVLNYPYLGAHSGIVPIQLSTAVIATAPIVTLSDTSIDLGSRTICQNDTTLDITITNFSCDSTSFSNFRIDAGSAFRLLDLDDTVIPPNGTLQMQIAYHADRDGAQSQSMTVHISRTDGSLRRDTSITFSVNVTGQRRMLQSQESSIDAGETHICEERDTFVVVQNIGCDTICVSNVIVRPSGFILTSSIGPFCIGPGDYDTIWLRTQIDTTGHALVNNASLTIITDTQAQLEPITLSREIVYPTPWAISISQPDSCYAGESVAYKIFQHGLLAADAAGADMNVVFNDDMLELTGIDEPSVSKQAYYRDPLGNAHYLLHIASVNSDSVLATLHLFAYQTRAVSTPITLDSIYVNSSDGLSSDCIADVTLDSSAFSLRNNCNSPLLSESLNGRPLSFSIEPNPATEFAHILYSLALNSPVSGTIRIEDALGRIAASKTVLLMPGNSNLLPLDLSMLPAGVYCARIVLSNEEQSARLIKE